MQVITPFNREENLELLSAVLKDKCNWTVLIDRDIKFPDWVNVKRYDKAPLGVCPSNWLFNKFIDEGLEDEEQYMILCDDDSVEEGFFDKIPNEDVVITSMKRGERVPEVGCGYGRGDLIASPDNLGIGLVAGEQCILKGKVLKNYRYGLSSVGDGEMIMQVVKNEPLITFVPNAFVLFNYFEDGRFDSFRRKPLVLFVGDYYCAGVPQMGKSEWEGNIAHSLDSTDLANVICFHPDKYYLETGRRGDKSLLERVAEYKPDYTVLIIYKQPESDPTVISLDTISKLPNLITIWGDLEAQEQVELSKLIAPYCKQVIGTANKSVVESLGYKYLHVPKDPRIFCLPEKELRGRTDVGYEGWLPALRDIEVIFSGSYSSGRPERYEVLKYLLDNGVKLVIGGSEGVDHFTTEEYAERYKRAKIAISFSQARGMNVVNARPFEVLHCGAMLLEQDSPELAKLYDEGVDYAVWKTKEDLLEKIWYYLSNNEERLSISESGHKKTVENYSAKTFWNKII